MAVTRGKGKVREVSGLTEFISKFMVIMLVTPL